MEVTVEFLESALQTLKEEIFSTLHVAMPGILQSYDPETQTATIQPALQRRSATGETIAAPILHDVPVFRCNSATDPAPDASCLLIFADFCIDGFLAIGEPTLPASP